MLYYQTLWGREEGDKHREGHPPSLYETLVYYSYTPVLRTTHVTPSYLLRVVVRKFPERS